MRCQGRDTLFSPLRPLVTEWWQNFLQLFSSHSLHLVTTRYLLPVVLVQLFCMNGSVAREKNSRQVARNGAWFILLQVNSIKKTQIATRVNLKAQGASTESERHSVHREKRNRYFGERERERRINKSRCSRYHLSSFVEVTWHPCK